MNHSLARLLKNFSISPAADLWSIGCLFGLMLSAEGPTIRTCRAPFPDNDVWGLLKTIILELGSPEAADLEFIIDSKVRTCCEQASCRTFSTGHYGMCTIAPMG